MSSGMNMQEAKKVAERMSYRQAVLNCLDARCVPFRKATKIKMKQLLELIDNDFADDLLNMVYTKGYQNGRADAIEEILKKVVSLRNIEECPKGCPCVDVIGICPYIECNDDVIRILDDMKEKTNG